jgi:hypothetical protein
LAQVRKRLGSWTAGSFSSGISSPTGDGPAVRVRAVSKPEAEWGEIDELAPVGYHWNSSPQTPTTPPPHRGSAERHQPARPGLTARTMAIYRQREAVSSTLKEHKRMLMREPVDKKQAPPSPEAGPRPEERWRVSSAVPHNEPFWASERLASNPFLEPPPEARRSSPIFVQAESYSTESVVSPVQLPSEAYFGRLPPPLPASEATPARKEEDEQSVAAPPLSLTLQPMRDASSGDGTGLVSSPVGRVWPVRERERKTTLPQTLKTSWVRSPTSPAPRQSKRTSVVQLASQGVSASDVLALVKAAGRSRSLSNLSGMSWPDSGPSADEEDLSVPDWVSRLDEHKYALDFEKVERDDRGRLWLRRSSSSRQPRPDTPLRRHRPPERLRLSYIIEPYGEEDDEHDWPEVFNDDQPTQRWRHYDDTNMLSTELEEGEEAGECEEGDAEAQDEDYGYDAEAQDEDYGYDAEAQDEDYGYDAEAQDEDYGYDAEAQDQDYEAREDEPGGDWETDTGTEQQQHEEEGDTDDQEHLQTDEYLLNDEAPPNVGYPGLPLSPMQTGGGTAEEWTEGPEPEASLSFAEFAYPDLAIARRQAMAE